MTGGQLIAACQADPVIEHEHLMSLFPSGTTRHRPAARPGDDGASCAVLSWARSGLMDLTGPPDGPPLAPPFPVLTRAAILSGAIENLAGDLGRPVRLDLRAIFAGRAADRGWHRGGTVSGNRTCRLLAAADGWLAVNLARPDDIRSIPALLGRDTSADPWAELTADAAAWPAADLAARAQLLGIPAAVVASAPPAPVRLVPAGPRGTATPLVLDLSALWAGPLCASILRRAGWRTLKAEDARRPDAARSGSPQFYAGLHAGGQAVQLDFGAESGRAELRRLAGQAGIVVESSRPRALRRLGLVAEDWLAAAPGRVWISITGYGREDPQQRVAFGDDAAAAGGLVARGPDGTPAFCGDAIADPLTGMLAAFAGLAAVRAGGGVLADLSMAGISADLARPGTGPDWPHRITSDGTGWVVSHGRYRQVVLSP
jgi:hypothetical protein